MPAAITKPAAAKLFVHDSQEYDFAGVFKIKNINRKEQNLVNIKDPPNSFINSN
jgi:hypothetical protein